MILTSEMAEYFGNPSHLLPLPDPPLIKHGYIVLALKLDKIMNYLDLT
jgi:hypothetical protein